MTDAEVERRDHAYEVELGIPATDALTRSPDRLVEMVCRRSPSSTRQLATAGAG